MKPVRLIPAHAGKTRTLSRPLYGPPAHPRSRGENFFYLSVCATPRGSSPLTRGKLHVRAVAVDGGRLIPAHAGKTGWPFGVVCWVTAHPRSRGENLPSLPFLYPFTGSSPLTRGKPGRTRHLKMWIGLIPAHAGKTTHNPERPPHGAAHPRSRGENRRSVSSCVIAAGSSPLTRGKLELATLLLQSFRLIPAHAGKTSPSGPKPVNKTAHPRSRGENQESVSWVIFLTGSSPLTRGKHVNIPLPACRCRLIPAHAGKTYSYSAIDFLNTAHPRSRGENGVSEQEFHEMAGSSPLTRGKPVQGALKALSPRLIPAHAGKTRRGAPRRPGFPAHPRSRGENDCELNYTRGYGGSSPLTRGKRGSQSPRSGDAGLIPAHAGKTLALLDEEKVPRAHPRSRGENFRLSGFYLLLTGSSPLTRGKPTRKTSTSTTHRLIPAHAGKTTMRRCSPDRSPAHPRSRGENSNASRA